MDAEQKGFEKDFSETGFWDKVEKTAKAAGLEVIENALQLYYASQQSDTPIWAKRVIFSALGFFICPMDAVPDVIPVLGYVDDLGVLFAAWAAVALYITDDVKLTAKNKLKEWFDE